MKTFFIILVLLVFGAGIYFIIKSDELVAPEPTPTPAHVTTRGNGDLIVLEEPLSSDIVSSPLKIKGRARGNWFFEASFPFVLTDWDGKIIVQHYIMTADEWMTTDYVPFEATLEFEVPEDGDTGSLILQKDNPSGLPEHDDALEIQVRFR